MYLYCYMLEIIFFNYMSKHLYFILEYHSGNDNIDIFWIGSDVVINKEED